MHDSQSYSQIVTNWGRSISSHSTLQQIIIFTSKQAQWPSGHELQEQFSSDYSVFGEQVLFGFFSQNISKVSKQYS